MTAAERIRIWSVQALVLAASDAIAARLGAAAVEGEITGFTRAASGHCYFTLKDPQAGALLRCAMFRRSSVVLPFAPRDGMRVQLRGRLSVYEARGELQYVAESMLLAGEGALYEQFRRLEQRLRAEGWFDAARKRELPAMVHRIGVVTSLAGAALHDVVTSLARRAPHVEMLVVHTPVQGAQAPAAIVNALQAANERSDLDVLLLVRGGGSLEDLWAFNDEQVVRAIASSRLPVVVGVGHESDLTLADLAADVRAPTPTAAAELAVPARTSLSSALDGLSERTERAVRRRIDQCWSRLDRASLLATKPARLIDHHRRRLDALARRVPRALSVVTSQQRDRCARLESRLETALRGRLDREQQRVQRAHTRWHALSPERVLARGYAWIGDARGMPVLSIAALAVGDEVRATLADGELRAKVLDVAPTVPAAVRLQREDP
jgi:exodeoxyribonuclease VII large subunit